jgi:methyl-accepting chemotaxis protein
MNIMPPMAILDRLIPGRSAAAANYRLYEQLPYVAWTNLTLFAGFTILFATLLIALGSVPITLIIAATLVAIAVSIALVHRGRYFAAANLTSVSLVVVACAFVYLMPYVGNNPREIYRGLAFGAVMAAINLVVSLKSRQVWIFFLLFASAWLFAFATIFAHYAVEDSTEFFSILVAGTLGFVCENIMFLLIRHLSEKMIKKAEEQTRSSADSLAKLTSLLSEAREGMSIGGQVVQSTGRAKEAAANISLIQEFLAGESKRLLDESGSIIGSSQKVLGNTRKIEDAMNSQNSAILETSTALVQISQNVENINKVAIQRRKMLDAVTKTGIKQRQQIERLTAAFASVQESSASIRRFVATVQDIASRTSLLSMNASIEAARAGSTGKGFAVVAQEIRGLSEETQRNSDLIQQGVEKNERTVRDTGAIVESFSSFVAKNIESTSALIDSIDEILNGVAEASTGIGEVSKAVNSIVEEMHASGEQAKEVAAQIGSQDKGLTHLAQFGQELDRRILSLREAVDEIRAAVEDAAEAGRLNIEQVQKLQSTD